jgi:hypothetical protein
MYPTPYKMASHCQLQLQILIDNWCDFQPLLWFKAVPTAASL